METPNKLAQQTLKTILSESWRVIKSQPRLFLTLSLLFIVPLRAAYDIFQTLHPGPASPANTNLILFALTSFLSLIFYSCADISIISATFRSYNDSKPTDLKTALKSISAAFFPYLATTLLCIVILSAAMLVFMLVPTFLVIIIVGLLLDFSALNTYFPYFVAFIVLIAFVSFIYFKINWSLAFPIIVVESRWGFEALRTSKGLIKGKIWTLVSLILVLLVFSAIISSSNFAASLSLKSFLVGSRSSTSASWVCLLGIAVWICLNIVLGTLLQLYAIVATTVLYAICKASNGGEYLSLRVNDDKVSSVA